MDGSFGALLRTHRIKAGLTQEALAERAALSGQAVGALERGGRRFPHRDTIARLAEALGLTDEQHAAFVAAASRPPVPKSCAFKESGPQTGAAQPRQLPAAVAGFTGRIEHLKAMNELLGRSSTMVLWVISGMAGIGKTAFAVHWAYQVREQFPDGQLYVNLRGYDPGHAPMSPETAIRTFLEALDVAPQRIPANLDAQTGLYRSLSADRRMLIVLDNAVDAQQVRPLLPGAPGCLVVVTSRNQLTSLAASDGANLITLDPLTIDEAHELLVARLGADRVWTQPHSVDEIITRCARLPLALVIVAARAASHPHFPLAAIANELRQAQGSLDAFHGGDATTNVRSVFSWSYNALPPEAARLLRLLGIHPGPDIAAPAAASLADLSVRRTRLLLGELSRMNLIAERAPGRYTLHDLVRAYAGEQAAVCEPDDQRQAALHRMLDHYLHTAYTACRMLNPARDPITLTAPQPGTTPENPADNRQSLDWFRAERQVLLSAVNQATKAACDTHTWQLAWTLTDFLNGHGHWHENIAAQRAAVIAARRLADPVAQGGAHRLLALAFMNASQFDEAHTHLGHALDLAVQAKDVIRQAHTHYHINVVLDRQGRHRKAAHHARQALALYKATGHRAGQARALNAIGWNHALLGEYRQALTNCQKSLVLQQELGNRTGQAPVWDSLGYAHHHLGHHEQAQVCYQHAIELHRDLGNRYNEADTLTHLGDTHHAAQSLEAARTAWQEALTILIELGHPDADHVRAKLRHLERHDLPTVGGGRERARSYSNVGCLANPGGLKG